MEKSAPPSLNEAPVVGLYSELYNFRKHTVKRCDKCFLNHFRRDRFTVQLQIHRSTRICNQFDLITVIHRGPYMPARA